ncbi:MAG: translation initiation factor IF-2 N-terminal domain-containing protein, partial [bacterium]|nr:translation initiation factor IF-2 N-terminal domain-containing protein [bacterium]
MVRKLRVYELAKHYGVDSPVILKMLRDMHAEAKSHMSVVEDDVIEKIHASYQRKREIMRVNYAQAHNLDPEKLKHVASFRPLDLPVAPDEPEVEKKPAKPAKKTVKKKVAAKKEPAAKEPAAGKTATAKADGKVVADGETAAAAPPRPGPAAAPMTDAEAAGKPAVAKPPKNPAPPPVEAPAEP